MVPFFLDNPKNIAVALRHMANKPPGPADVISDRCLRAGRELEKASVALMALRDAAGCLSNDPATLRHAIVAMKSQAKIAAVAVRTSWALVEDASEVARQFKRSL